MKYWKVIILAVVIAAGLAVRLFVSMRLYSGDVNNHIAWAKEFDRSGPAGLYSRDFTTKYKVMAPTYPPVALGLFVMAFTIFGQTVRLVNVIGRLVPTVFTTWVIAMGHPNTLPGFLKLPAILADVGIALGLYQIVKSKGKTWKWAIIITMVALFNPAIWFNSAAWGQIESIPIFFIILASLVLVKDHLRLAGVAMAISILVKQSAIIFLPYFFVYVYKKKGWKFCVQTVVLQMAVMVLTFLPFERSFDVLWPFRVYIEKVMTGSGSDFVTDHAFNFWAIVSGLGKIPDSSRWLANVSYGTYGLVLTGIVALLLEGWLWRRTSIENLWKSWVLIGMTVFFLATRMHERYLGPVVILWLLPWGKWSKAMAVGYLYISIFNLANMYHTWWEPRIGWAVALLTPESNVKLATLFALGIYVWLLVKWTRNGTES